MPRVWFIFFLGLVCVSFFLFALFLLVLCGLSLIYIYIYINVFKGEMIRRGIFMSMRQGFEA